MNRRDIALSVGGTLASMALAYLFYRHENATSTTPASVATDAADASYSNGNVYDTYASSSPIAAIPSLATGSVSSDTGTVLSSSSDTSDQSGSFQSELMQIIQQYSIAPQIAPVLSSPVTGTAPTLPISTVTPLASAESSGVHNDHIVLPVNNTYDVSVAQ